jgi:hypothetical protein
VLSAASVRKTAVNFRVIRVRVRVIKPYWEQVWNEKYGLLWRIEPLGGDGPAFEARSRHVRNIRNMGKDGYDGLWKAGHEDWRGLCFALFLIC